MISVKNMKFGSFLPSFTKNLAKLANFSISLAIFGKNIAIFFENFAIFGELIYHILFQVKNSTRYDYSGQYDYFYRMKIPPGTIIRAARLFGPLE